MADFAERFGPWFGMRERQDIDDRRDEPWPWHNVVKNEPQQSMTGPAISDQVLGNLSTTQQPPLSPLGVAAGVRDVKAPPPEELIRFLIDIDSHNPDPPGRKVSNGR